MTEDQMINGIRRVVRRNHMRVSDPDYRTGRYPPQWKTFGAVKYYQLPREGRIIAKYYPANGGMGPFHFNRKGLIVPGVNNEH